MAIKELRKEKGLTQLACANLLKIPYRTYCRYEADDSKLSHLKYQYIFDALNEYGRIDEEHGILTIEQIKEICAKTFEPYDIKYAYLFGSYAKGKATEKSDVDLLVSTTLRGLDFFGMVEDLRTNLNKKVDVLDVHQLKNNVILSNEIFMDGIKIYG